MKKHIDVKAETLRKAVNRAKEKGAVHFHGHCTVPVEVEHILVNFCTSLSNRGTPVTDSYLLKLAREGTGMDLSTSWLKGFKDRWESCLKRGKSSSMEAARITSLTTDELEKWIKAFEAEQRYILPDGSNLFNADEVPAKYSANSPVLVWASRVQVKIGCLDSRDQQVKTFVPFISANGKLWMLLLIYESPADRAESDVFLPATFEDLDEPPFSVLLASTAKGYMTTALWKSACEAFCQLLYVEFAQKECVLVLDNLSAHVNHQVVASLAKSSLRCFFIPVHTSHILQPLDNGANAAVAQEVRHQRASKNRDSILSGESVTGIIPTLIVSAAYNKLTSTVIRGTWERTGLYPFDPSRVRELALPYLSSDDKTAANDVQVALEHIAQHYLDKALQMTSPFKSKRGTIAARSSKVYTVEEIAARHKRAQFEKQKAKDDKETALAQRKIDREQKKADNALRKAELDAAKPKKVARGPLTYCDACAGIHPASTLRRA